MPIYVYSCGSCGLAQEYLSLSATDVLRQCGHCQSGDVSREVTAGSFRLKGGGWAGDGYGSSPRGPDRGAKEARLRSDIRERHHERTQENDRNAKALGLKRVGKYREISVYPDRPIE